MDVVLYITTVVEHLLNRVLQFPVRKANAADTVQHNLFVLPNYDEPDFPPAGCWGFRGALQQLDGHADVGVKSHDGCPPPEQCAAAVPDWPVVGKATKVARAHVPIAGGSSMSAANLSH